MPRETFTIDTNLKMTKSPLTADFVDAYLETKREGKLSGIGEAVVAAAVKYGINATYIVSHAALETAWGSSAIANQKNNLFGWSAFDDSPYESSKSFPSRAACIDFVMGRVNELYLTEGGRYFRRAPCVGKGREPGTRGYGMNANYASDPQWGVKIAKIGEAMEAAFERTAPAATLPLPGVTEAELPLKNVEALLARARSAAGHRMKYQLGQGGDKPNALLPGTPAGGCDCSGYVCWCLGVSRKTDHPLYVKYNSGWINTDAIVYDAGAPTGLFSKLEEARVGCIVVYPSKRPTRKYGHVGIVTAVENGAASKVIHCSSGNYANLQDAIAETSADTFTKNDAIFAWYDGVI